jgi:ferric enterobactin receptor
VKEKVIIFIGLFIAFFYHGFSQQLPVAGVCKIKGRIMDSVSRQPVGYATVTAFLNGSSNVAGGIITDDNGQFIIDNLQAGEYRVKIEFIGYGPIIKTGVVVTNNKTVANLGNVLLAGGARKLKEVTVTANTQFMENHLDKLVYNVDKDVTSQGGVATDVLKKVPMVSVDIDGNIDLLGDANVRVFINGKPSAMFDNNLAEALKAIPANQIKSIEVITSPGAQYDAQGTGGIINIILKDNKAKGVNGNCSVSGGSRYQNGSANVHVKNGSLDINASLSGNEQLNTKTLNSLDRTADSAGLVQNGYGQVQRNGYRAQAGFDWAVNKHNDITGSFSYNNFGNTNQGLINQQQITDYPVIADTYTVRNTTNYYRYSGEDWNLNYKKSFGKEGQELNLSYQGSSAGSVVRYTQDQLYAQNNYLFSGARGDNGVTDLENYITADYTHPFTKDIVLNAGLKGSFSNVMSSSDHYGLIPSSGGYNFDPSQLDHFNYNRGIYAAYTSITFKLGKDYDVKLGVRDEYTKNDVPDDTVVIASYNFITPSGVISRSLNHHQSIKFSYSRRIQRPGFGQYNPFINATDPTSLSQGNPQLQPEKKHSFELSYYKFYDKGSSVLVTLFYRYSAYDWQGYSTYYSSFRVGDSVYQNTTVSTTANAGNQQTTGLNISGTWKVSDKLEFRVNTSFFDKYIQSTLPGIGVVNSFTYRASINATYQFTKNLVAEVYGGYNSATLEAQGKFPSFASYSIALRQQFWGKKANIALSATDPFNTYTNQLTYITSSNFSSVSERRSPYQYFSISFSYKFGKIEYKDKKQDGNVNDNLPPEATPPTGG